MTKVVEKKKVDNKKVEKTAPATTKTTNKSNTEIKSTTTIAKATNKSKESTTVTKTLNKDSSLQIIGLEDLINNSNNSNNKKEKQIKTINTNLKGDQLVKEILSFFNLQISSVKLNDISLLENEIKDNNQIIEIVSNNYNMIMELVKELLDSNEITSLIVLLMISKTVSSFNQPNLIEKLLIQKDNYSLVSMVSKCFSDISSDNIKDLIQYILNNKQFKSIKDQLEQLQSLSSTSTSDIKSSKELDSILTIPISHDSMVVSIRSLPINLVLLLLKYLYSRISLFSLSNNDDQLNNNNNNNQNINNNNNTTIIATNNNNNNNNSFTLKQIIDWISLIFDSHYQELSKVENINQYFGPIRSLHNNTKSFFYTKSFIDFLDKSSTTKSIENNNYSIYHYKF